MMRWVHLVMSVTSRRARYEFCYMPPPAGRPPVSSAALPSSPLLQDQQLASQDVILVNERRPSLEDMSLLELDEVLSSVLEPERTNFVSGFMAKMWIWSRVLLRLWSCFPQRLVVI